MANVDDVRHALIVLGLDVSFARVVSVYKLAGPRCGEAAMVVFKKLVQRKRRELAPVAHPDHGGSAMAVINEACNILLSIQLKAGRDDLNIR